MLYPTNDYLLYLTKKELTNNYIREAQVDHLVGQIEPRGRSFFATALHPLGHLLMAFGARLERVGSPQSA